MKWFWFRKKPIEKAVLNGDISKLATEAPNEILRNIAKRVQDSKSVHHYSRVHHRHSRR